MDGAHISYSVELFVRQLSRLCISGEEATLHKALKDVWPEVEDAVIDKMKLAVVILFLEHLIEVLFFLLYHVLDDFVFANLQ